MRWMLERNAGGACFAGKQMKWLRSIKERIGGVAEPQNQVNWIWIHLTTREATR